MGCAFVVKEEEGLEEEEETYWGTLAHLPVESNSQPWYAH
jgi:hypothetical protein